MSTSRHPRYDLLAIDLDGTLLCSKGTVSAACKEAIRDARRHGIAVTLCTGRGLAECRHFAEEIEQRDPVVVAGGAIIACPVRRQTLHRFAMEHALVAELVAEINARGHAAMLLKDPLGTAAFSPPLVDAALRAAWGQTETGAPAPGSESRATIFEPGHDYVIVSPLGLPAVSPISLWWFEKLKVKHIIVRGLAEDAHPEHTVRVGLCGPRKVTTPIAEEIAAKFAGRTTMQHFAAVVPEKARQGDDNEVLIMEAFGEGVHKWAAIEHLGGLMGTSARRIAAIGNDVNDLTMLQSAGLGIAMASSIPEALAAADVVTRGNDEQGVAHAIEKILKGEW